jgi:hypothetical protein
MPTVGWIFEDAVERIGESLDSLESDRHPVVACPYPGCGRQFKSSDELLQHLGLEHPVNIPVLQIQSRSMPSEFSVRAPFSPGDVALLNCTTCEVRFDAGEVQNITPVRLRELLAAQRSSICELRLINERARDRNQAAANFAARFRIPTEQALRAIDDEFVRRLAIEHPRIADVETFRTACPDETAAHEYAAALGDYVIGLAIKERHPDAPVYADFETYKEKFAGAIAVLKEFHRPVSLAVTAAISFNTNNFSVAPSGHLPVLNSAFLFFGSVAAGNEPRTHSAAAGTQSAPICPVDITTHRILEATQRATTDRTPHPMVADDLDSLSRRKPLSEYDAAKIRAVSAYVLTRLGKSEEAESQLRRLQFTAPFESWAKSQLESLTLHGNPATK